VSIIYLVDRCDTDIDKCWWLLDDLGLRYEHSITILGGWCFPRVEVVKNDYSWLALQAGEIYGLIFWSNGHKYTMIVKYIQFSFVLTIFVERLDNVFCAFC
jgi:hypothetical protein